MYNAYLQGCEAQRRASPQMRSGPITACLYTLPHWQERYRGEIGAVGTVMWLVPIGFSERAFYQKGPVQHGTITWCYCASPSGSSTYSALAALPSRRCRAAT